MKVGGSGDWVLLSFICLFRRFCKWQLCQWKPLNLHFSLLRAANRCADSDTELNKAGIWIVPCCKTQQCQLDQFENWAVQAGLAGYELVNQHGQAGHEAGLAGYELVNQHGQAGHEAGLAGYELVNQHGWAGHEAGLAGYELVNQHGWAGHKLV